jgi:uncharacterized membrane protein YfcA
VKDGGNAFLHLSNLALKGVFGVAMLFIALKMIFAK